MTASAAKEPGDDVAAAELNGWLSKEHLPDEVHYSREVKREEREEAELQEILKKHQKQLDRGLPLHSRPVVPCSQTPGEKKFQETSRINDPQKPSAQPDGHIRSAGFFNVRISGGDG